jgi:ribosomal protein L11 methyltransferase
VSEPGLAETTGPQARWLEFSVTTGGEAAEAVVELFNRPGWGKAVVETPLDCFEYELEGAPPPSQVIVKTYLPLNGSAAEARRRLEEGLWHLGQIVPLPEPVIRELAEEDWTEGWKRQYHRLRVGARIVIVPAWEEYTPGPGEVAIRLEPGMAFGTGLHPTTRLCLAALETGVMPGCTLLDVGTGSGVLAIAAARLGAGRVLALEADPVAVRTARENVVANGVEQQVEVRHGSLPGGDVVPLHFEVDGPLDLLEIGQFDLVAINILAPVISGMAPALAARLAGDGKLIAAGLIEGQEQSVTAALQGQGLVVVRRAQEQDWVCLVAQRA